MCLEVLGYWHGGADFKGGGHCVDNEAEEEFFWQELEHRQDSPVEDLNGLVEVVGPCFL